MNWSGTGAAPINGVEPNWSGTGAAPINGVEPLLIGAGYGIRTRVNQLGRLTPDH